MLTLLLKSVCRENISLLQTLHLLEDRSKKILQSEVLTDEKGNVGWNINAKDLTVGIWLVVRFARARPH